MFCDVADVLVMLLSGLRCFCPVCFSFRAAGLGFVAVAAFFSSLAAFLSVFSFSSLSFFSFFSRNSFIDCSSVSTRANVVDMPPRRRNGGAGRTASAGATKIDETVSIVTGGEETGEGEDEDESNMRTGA